MFLSRRQQVDTTRARIRRGKSCRPEVESLENRCLLTNLPVIPSTSVFNAVPEAANYGVVYELSLPVNANFSSGITYTQDNTASVPTGGFDRIAYALELVSTASPTTTQWVWVSFTRPTNITAANKTGVPVLTTNEDYNFGNTTIASMNVFSNVGGIVTGTGITTGNIEFWPSNYGGGNSYNVPGAQGSFDFGDGGDSLSTGYGSMQVHNYGASQTLFAFNNWNTGGPTDLGIGNRTTADPDYTFASNAGSYSLRHMYVLVREPADLSVTKTANVTTAVPGTSIVYTVLVTNNSTTNTVLSAPVNDALPSGVTGASWTASATSGSSATATSGTGGISTTVNLAPGGSVTFTMTAQISPSASGSLANNATIAVPPGFFDPNLANNTATLTTPLVATADLAITKTATSSGRSIVYTITVTNSGPSDAPAVVVTDTLPSGVSFTSATTSQGTASAGSGSVVANFGTLAKGATAILTITVSSNVGGSLTNTATVSFSGTDPNPANNTATVTILGGAVAVIATGSDAGTPAFVNVYDARTHQLNFSLVPFGPFFFGGARVAVGDVNGDGVNDVIVGAGPGGLPEVLIFDGKTAGLMGAFFAFGGQGGLPPGTASIGGLPGFFTGGVYVAAGDVNGDGKADIIVGADAGAAPEVQVYDGASGALLTSFLAFAPTFKGGVRVAVGDVNGDGKADIICAAGRGGGPQVTVYDGVTGNVLQNFYAFAPFFSGGVYVASGDINGDRRADIIVGAGAGAGPQVSVFDGATNAVLDNYFAYPSFFTGGVRVGAADVNADGRTDILTSAGKGGLSQVTAFDSQTLAVLQSFMAYGLFTGGVHVGGG